MSFPLVLFILIILISIVVFIAFYKRNGHTELYSQGVRNENDGNYTLALRNYEDALKEAHKLKLGKKFGAKITQRIKLLRTTIDYEKNFHISRGA
jgi:outer membrane protein assembly factor BamD (BamD/ComL family)